MLVGSVVYKVGSKRYKYVVTGIDTASALMLKLESGSYDAMCLLNSVDCTDTDMVERRCDIGLVEVKVDSELTETVNGKKQKMPINWDFFCRLGSLVRYAKVGCNNSNEVGLTGLALASGEFEAKDSVEFVVPFPLEPDKVFAKVELCYGNIQKIWLEAGGITLELSESGYENGLFPKLQNGLRRGIRFNEEYLGFALPVQGLVTETVDGVYHSIEDIIKAHPEKELAWLLGKNYQIVNDDDLKDICNYILSYDGLVYYDTETTGLRLNFRSRTGQADQLVGVVLSVKDGESFYFPMQMKVVPNLCGGDHWYFMQHYMKPILEGKDLVAHNASFDWKAAYIYDINANIVHDTMALIRLTLGAENEDYPMGLKEITKLLLHRDSLELSDLVFADKWGESDVKFWDLPSELVRLYACADTDNTRGILQYALAHDLLGKYNARKVYEIEIAFSYAVGYQEFMGHHLDIHNFDEMRKEIAEGQDKLMKRMVKIVGYEFNPNSAPALLRIMYKELGIPEQISRKTGRPTTNKKALERLASLTDEEDNVKYPFCVLLQKFREYEAVRKLVDKFPEHVTEDGFVFSDVMQYGTSTGRVSIHNPNYQSYNDPVKKNTIPRPGYWAFDTDYSSVEYRILANMAGNERIKENFNDPDFDYHTYQAAHMYGVPYAAVTKKLRKAAKGINFGLPYGMGDESLGETVFGEATDENTREAGSLRKAYFNGQEDIRDWFEYHRNMGVTVGYTETYFSRRRYYPKSKTSTGSIRRQAGNQVIQGCMGGDTRIQTLELGIVKLKDAVGYNYMVWDGKDWTSGDVLYSGKKRKCIVHFAGGMDMVCSPQHKFLVREANGSERFVECKDLMPLAHRVVRNEMHVPSEFCYFSERDSGDTGVRLDAIGNGFDIGVVLGRLSASGSCSLEDGRLLQDVWMDELDILPELRSCLDKLGYAEVSDGMDGGIVHLVVEDKALATEVQAMDIKNQIHEDIFMDTEVLRGFLSGFLDGAACVSEDGEICVWFEQLEPMLLDIQKALLFFGIRSSYSNCDDGYLLEIMDEDRVRFLDRIGFLNPDKMAVSRGLRCRRDDSVYSNCMMIESVEVTDEYIDMYDVCNTKRGYYVADGVVTHNTAADIYKIAVGRVFKRICREGWLGKVLLTGFIHDELFGEVSNDINPAVFLKVLREEFEVKITNSDGTPWCPLYMGFGYGRSWYEAKSVELPIKLQWEIVEKYGETGFPNWDGDIDKFCDSIPGMLRDFEIRDITKQITSPDTQNKEIKPALNVALIDACKADTKDYNSMVEQALSEYTGDEAGKLGYLRGILGDKLLVDSSGQGVLTLPVVNTTQECLDRFCWMHGVDRSGVNLLDIPEYTGATLNKDLPADYVDDSVPAVSIADVKVDTLGMYLDIENKMVILRMVPAIYMKFIQDRKNSEGRGYRIRFKDCEAKKFYDTQAWLESNQISIIQEMYLQYLSQFGGVRE